MNYNDAVKDAACNIAWYANRLSHLAGETRLSQLDLTCVSSLDVSETSIDFYLANDSDREQQRDFVISVSRVFQCGEMGKEQGWDKASIRVSGKSVDGKYIYIAGYVPPTCELVEVEEPVSEYDLKIAAETLATKTRKRMQVVCTEGGN